MVDILNSKTKKGAFLYMVNKPLLSPVQSTDKYTINLQIIPHSGIKN